MRCRSARRCRGRPVHRPARWRSLQAKAGVREHPLNATPVSTARDRGSCAHPPRPYRPSGAARGSRRPAARLTRSMATAFPEIGPPSSIHFLGRMRHVASEGRAAVLVDGPIAEPRRLDQRQCPWIPGAGRVPSFSDRRSPARRRARAPPRLPRSS